MPLMKYLEQRMGPSRYSLTSVGDPDPHVFGPPGSGSITLCFVSRSGAGSFHLLKKVLSGLKNACKIKLLKIMCLRVSFEKKLQKNFFLASFKSLKQGFGS